MRGTRALLALLVLPLLLALAPTPAVAQAPPEARLELASQTAWVRPGGSFDLRLLVDELDDDAAARLELVVTVHQRLRSRSAFAQTLEGRELRGTTRRQVLPLSDLPVDGRGERRVSLPFPTLAAGVYPVSVALRPAGGGTAVESFVTHLVALPEEEGTIPLSVAWVQPIGTAPVLRADGVRPLDGDERSRLTTAIDAVGGADLPVTLELTPETIAALTEGEVEPLRRSLERGSQLLATPFVDVDPGALAAAGRADDLAVQRQVGEDVLLATLGDRGDPRAWSAQPLDTTSVSRLRAFGVTRLVLPESSLEPLAPGVTQGRSLSRPFRLAAGGEQTVDAAAVDTGLAAHFDDDGDVDQVLAAHHLLADLAVLFFDLPGSERGVVVRPPEEWEPDAAFLGTVLRALAGSAALRPVTLDTFFDEVDLLEQGDRPVVRTATGQRGDVLPAARLQVAHRALDEVVAITGPGGGPAEAMRELLLVVESRRLGGRARNEILDAVIAGLTGIQGRLGIPEGRSFRLTAREGTIPLTVTNDNPFPVSTRLEVSSDKLEFPGGSGPDKGQRVLELELEPGTHTFAVPVRARASGSFVLRARLLAPTGEELLRRDVQINSSVFSGVGVVLSIGALLFLLLWWGRHWRTVRRDRRLVALAQ